MSVLADLTAAVPPVDAAAAAAARRRSASQARPPGSLGRLEDVMAQLAAIAGTCPPPAIRRPALLVAAGDHGVHAQGVSPWPQDVTAAMVGALCAGSATASVFAASVDATVAVLDVGVVRQVPPHDLLRSVRVRAGTRDLSVEDAMTSAEVEAAVLAGAEAAHAVVAGGADLLCLGDMGIANTTSSAALVAAFTGVPAALVTGRGTGIGDDVLAGKRRIVAAAVARSAGRPAVELLAALGGLEHAALVGVVLAGAAARVPVVLDGVITDAAALAAVALCPTARDYLVAGHRSVEPGAHVALQHLGLLPLLDLDLRLGEGTGALLAVPLIRAASAALREVGLLADLADDPT